jgi:hypothetical protein
MTYKKGDILTITFRNGYDAEGKPVMLTLERAEVLGCASGRLQVTYRDVDSQHADVEIDSIAFDISMSDVLMKQCETG